MCSRKSSQCEWSGARYRLRRRRCSRYGQPFSSPADIDRPQADEERQRRHNLKIDQALHADPPDAAQIAMPRDSRHQRAENQRRHNHLDQAQENVAEHPQMFGELRPVQPDFSAQQHREKNPVGQRRLAPSTSRDHGQRSPPCHHKPQMWGKKQRQGGSGQKKQHANRGESAERGRRPFRLRMIRL